VKDRLACPLVNRGPLAPSRLRQVTGAPCLQSTDDLLLRHELDERLWGEVGVVDGIVALVVVGDEQAQQLQAVAIVVARRRIEVEKAVHLATASAYSSGVRST
jgi:hypothetical protein